MVFTHPNPSLKMEGLHKSVLTKRHLLKFLIPNL